MSICDNNKPLLDKKILFVGIGFYDYDNAIIAKLIELGATVSYFWSCIHDLKYRILNKLGANSSALSHIQYLRTQEIERLSSGHDFVFLIKGENLSQEDFDLLKLKNPNANFILYLWDDLRRIANSDLLLRNISNIWSFDSDDCNKYGFKFRPLFYRDGLRSAKKDIALSSIGSCHSNRLDIFKNVSYQLDKLGLKYYLKLYINYRQYIRMRFLHKSFGKADKRFLIHKPLSYDDTMMIIASSYCVLDITHPSQKGLSIRTIEALRCGCHILTSNNGITCYSDISPESYTVFDHIQPSVIRAIFEHKVPLSKISSRYSIENFLREIFGCPLNMLDS